MPPTVNLPFPPSRTDLDGYAGQPASAAVWPTGQSVVQPGELNVAAIKGTTATFTGAVTGSNISGAGINSISLLSTTALNMNATNGTETTLYTVPTGKTMIPVLIVMRNASTSLTTAAWGVGFNAGTDTDFRASATSTGLTGSTLAYMYYGIATGVKVGAAAAIFAMILTTQQGGAASATMDVFGYLI